MVVIIYIMSKYIHPNFNPTDKDIYLKTVNKLRDKALTMNRGEIIYVSQKEYDILEDSLHPIMKNKGHQVYGVEIKVLNDT